MYPSCVCHLLIFNNFKKKSRFHLKCNFFVLVQRGLPMRECWLTSSTVCWVKRPGPQEAQEAQELEQWELECKGLPRKQVKPFVFERTSHLNVLSILKTCSLKVYSFPFYKNSCVIDILCFYIHLRALTTCSLKTKELETKPFVDSGAFSPLEFYLCSLKKRTLKQGRKKSFSLWLSFCRPREHVTGLYAQNLKVSPWN